MVPHQHINGLSPHPSSLIFLLTFTFSPPSFLLRSFLCPLIPCFFMESINLDILFMVPSRTFRDILLNF
jgi:hypothetical protein